MKRTAKSCGPDAPTLASNWRRCSRIALMMVATKPGHQGEHEGNRKTIAQGRPDVFRIPVVTNSRVFIYTRGRGCPAHPAFPAPSLEGRLRPLFQGGQRCSNSGASCRERAKVRLRATSLRGAKRRSNPSSLQCGNGLLRGVCHRAALCADPQ